MTVVKKITISILIIIFSFLVIVGSISTGLVAVSGFFFGISEQGIENPEYCSIEELIEYCGHRNIITEDMLDEMMIGRGSLKKLLKAVKKVNDENEKKSFHVSVKSQLTYMDEEGKKVTKEGSTKHITASTKSVAGAYELDWQPVYLAAILDGMQYADEDAIVKVGNALDLANALAVGVKKVSAKGNTYKGADVVLVGNTNADKIWNYYKAKGLTDIAAAAMLGNMMQESGCNPNSVSESGTYHGIAQWGGGRYTGLCNFAKKRGLNWNDLKTQLDYSWMELTGSYKSVLTYINKASHLNYVSMADEGAVWYIARYYEVCVSDTQKYGVQHYDKRFAYAKAFYKTHGGKGDVVVSQTELDGEDDIAVETSDINLRIGKFNKKGTRIILSDSDIEQLMEDFAPVFQWNLQEGASYSYEESKAAVGSVQKTNGGSADTAEGIEIWYEPAAILERAELCFADVEGRTDGTVAIYSNTSRWNSIITSYHKEYEKEWFETLIENLPGGEGCRDHYENIMACAVGESSSGSYISGGGEIAGASGTYKPLGKVKPSKEIPTNCGGMSIPLYYQWDSRWKSIPFGGGDIGSSGCSITSLAMVLSYLRNECIYPNDIEKWTGNRFYDGSSGQSWSIMQAVARQWGVQCKEYVASVSNIKRALKKGYPVIVSTTGPSGVSSGYFTSGGHFIVLRGLTEDGKVLVNDPNDSETKKHYSEAYTAEFIVKECSVSSSYVKHMWVFQKKQKEK